MNNQFVEVLKAHIRQMAPHIKQRLTSLLLVEAIDVIEELIDWRSVVDDPPPENKTIEVRHIIKATFIDDVWLYQPFRTPCPDEWREIPE